MLKIFEVAGEALLKSATMYSKNQELVV